MFICFPFAFSPLVEGKRCLSSKLNVSCHLVLTRMFLWSWQFCCSKTRWTRGVSEFHVNILYRSSNAVSFFSSLWHWEIDCFCSWNPMGQAEVGSLEESYKYIKMCSPLTYLLLSFFPLKMWLGGFYDYFRIEWGNLECCKLDRLKTRPDKIIHVRDQK